MAEKPSVGVSTNISENNENSLSEQIQHTMEFTNVDALKGIIIGISERSQPEQAKLMHLANMSNIDSIRSKWKHCKTASMGDRDND